MARFRKNVKTPARFQQDGVAAVRPRSEGVVKKQNSAEHSSSSSANSSPAAYLPVKPKQIKTVPPSNVSTQPGNSCKSPSHNISLQSEQSSTSDLSVMVGKLSAEKAPASVRHAIGRAGRDGASDERFYFVQTWDNLTDTAKLILMCEVGEHFEGNLIRSAKFLQLDNREMHKICDLQDEESQRERQLKIDTENYNFYLLNLGDTTKKNLVPAQRQAIQRCEAEQGHNLKELAPSGYEVQREGILEAQRFLRARCKEGPILEAVIRRLLDYVGQDYSLHIVGSVIHDDELEDGEAEDLQPAHLGVLQQPTGSSSSAASASPSSSRLQHLPRLRSHLNIVETVNYDKE